MVMMKSWNKNQPKLEFNALEIDTENLLGFSLFIWRIFILSSKFLKNILVQKNIFFFK